MSLEYVACTPTLTPAPTPTPTPASVSPPLPPLPPLLLGWRGDADATAGDDAPALPSAPSGTAATGGLLAPKANGAAPAAAVTPSSSTSVSSSSSIGSKRLLPMEEWETRELGSAALDGDGDDVHRPDMWFQLSRRKRARRVWGVSTPNLLSLPKLSSDVMPLSSRSVSRVCARAEAGVSLATLFSSAAASSALRFFWTSLNEARTMAMKRLRTRKDTKTVMSTKYSTAASVTACMVPRMMKLVPGGRAATRNTVRKLVPRASKPELPPLGDSHRVQYWPDGHPALSNCPSSIPTYLHGGHNA